MIRDFDHLVGLLDQPVEISGKFYLCSIREVGL
jgi:hypothetical protein